MAAIKAGFAYACALLGVIVALSAPAFADDADLKKQVEQIYSAYVELQQAGCGQISCAVRDRCHHRRSGGATHGYRQGLRGHLQGGNKSLTG
jgi:hypothetical protein